MNRVSPLEVAMVTVLLVPFVVNMGCNCVWDTVTAGDSRIEVIPLVVTAGAVDVGEIIMVVAVYDGIGLIFRGGVFSLLSTCAICRIAWRVGSGFNAGKAGVRWSRRCTGSLVGF